LVWLTIDALLVFHQGCALALKKWCRVVGVAASQSIRTWSVDGATTLLIMLEDNVLHRSLTVK